MIRANRLFLGGLGPACIHEKHIGGIHAAPDILHGVSAAG